MITSSVQLRIVSGPMLGRQLRFDEHDTFIFGRMPDCHCSLPDDQQVSRHHFLLEINPPQACLRDLGSLNGTYLNGLKHGGRQRGETPEEGARRKYPELDLKDGDEIRVGQTMLKVRIEASAFCAECGRAIADAEHAKCRWLGGTFICAKCKQKLEANTAPKASSSKEADKDPIKVLDQLLKQAHREMPLIQGLELERMLGQGAFGAVYLAKQRKDPRHVAIKIMLSKIAVDERSRQKFAQEIEVMRQLRHENIVRLLEHSSTGEAFYFLMEFCDRGSVAELMVRRGGKLSPGEASPIMLQCLQGLACAHQHGFVHRDLKPQNLLLTRSPQLAKVGDFGFAKSFQQAGFSGMTVTGSYAGTLHFMPREQVINFKYVKPVSDVWSMGATLYHMLTGQLPRDLLRGIDPIEVILGGKIVPLRQRDASLPKKLAEVVDQAVSNEPKERFQDAAQMREALAKAF